MRPLRATVDLSSTAGAPRAARQAVRALLEAWGVEDLSEDAELLLNEVVTNAVEHANSSDHLEVGALLSGGRLTLSVADGSAIRPVVREMDPRSLRGRGMYLVAQVASRWGVEDLDGGKRVWFELRTAPATS